MCGGAGGGSGGNPSFHPLDDAGVGDNAFNLAQNYGTPCGGATGGGRRKRRALLMRDASAAALHKAGTVVGEPLELASGAAMMGRIINRI